VWALILVAALVGTSVTWTAYRRWTDRPPFAPSAVQATATVRFTDWSRFEQDARSIGALDLGARPAGAEDDRIFVGRLDHRTPADAGDQDFYHVLVVDKRNERLAGIGNVVQGPPAYMTELSQRYPWLPPPGTTGSEHTASLIEVPANRPDPITFAGTLPNAQQLTDSDLMVVLVLVRRDGTPHWAERVTG
jgi:hypothetical protein